MLNERLTSCSAPSRWKENNKLQVQSGTGANDGISHRGERVWVLGLHPSGVPQWLGSGWTVPFLLSIERGKKDDFCEKFATHSRIRPARLRKGRVELDILEWAIILHLTSHGEAYQFSEGTLLTKSTSLTRHRNYANTIEGLKGSG